MGIDFSGLWSDLAGNMKASEIRELLKLTANPAIISFAGGLPNPESFPVDELKEIAQHVLEEHWQQALQYGATEGVTEFRDHLKEAYAKEDEYKEGDSLIITNGSQQALDLLGKVMLNSGDRLIAEAPTYLGGANAFMVYGASVTHVEMDDDGMKVDELEKTLYSMKSLGQMPKYIYAIPTFQNPAGVTMPESRRRQLLDLVYQFDDLLIVEDDPYGRLRFEGEHQRSLKALDDQNRVMSMKTLSKVLTPGFRIGILSGPKDLIQKIVFAKQSADLCSPSLTQYLAWHYMAKGYVDRQLPKICELYKRKRDIMLKAMDEHMPEGVRWTRPEGGMFLWATIEGRKINTDDLFLKAIQRNVAFVVGRPFYTDGRGTDSMRINFSFSKDEDIPIGVERLADTIRDEQAKHEGIL
jgi:2-aminoadipate transaminase